MKHSFEAPTTWARSVSAVAAVVSTLFVIGSIDGLAQHYSALESDQTRTEDVRLWPAGEIAISARPSESTPPRARKAQVYN